MTNKNIVHRLKIAKGHIAKIIEMVESGAYCVDVVHQSMAVQSALKKIDEIVLENHLNSCVVDSIKAGKADKSIREIMDVVKKK